MSPPRSQPAVTPWRGVLDLLAPPRCLSCRARGSAPWCPPCHAEVRILGAGCARCSAPQGAAHACWPADAPVAGTVAAYDYRGVVAAAIVTAKLAGAHAGWPGLLAPLAARLQADPPPVDVVTAVTTPASRVRERGRDHAVMLAELVAEALGLPTLPLLQAVAGGDGRDRYRARHRLPGTDVLLVDDVLTTGATAWRAAAALRAAGAGAIHLAVLARAGTHPLGVAARHAR